MTESVLPKLAKTELTEALPADPTELLTDEQQRELSNDLAQLAETEGVTRSEMIRRLLSEAVAARARMGGKR